MSPGSSAKWARPTAPRPPPSHDVPDSSWSRCRDRAGTRLGSRMPSAPYLSGREQRLQGPARACFEGGAAAYGVRLGVTARYHCARLGVMLIRLILRLLVLAVIIGAAAELVSGIHVHGGFGALPLVPLLFFGADFFG